jgi:hypothetical protein
VPATAAAGTATHELAKSDVDACLDGFMPYTMRVAGVPGAVVVVAKGRPAADYARLRLCRRQGAKAGRSEHDPVPPP